MAGILSGYPLDTLRIHLQQPSNTSSAFGLLHSIVSSEGPSALYRGMAAPLAYITFQNAMVFQVYAVLSRSFDSLIGINDPPSLKSVILGGVGTGALQSLIISPVELLKIRLQLQRSRNQQHNPNDKEGPLSVAKDILRREGVRGLYRGLTITVIRDAPSFGVYFWTYEYAREQLHPGCRKSGQEKLTTMLAAGGTAGVASWVSCYPLDVVKSRLQAQLESRLDQLQPKYRGILDCFCNSIVEEGYGVLWRGLGIAVVRAFVVNGAIFAAYEISLRCLFDKNHLETNQTEKTRL